MYLFPARGAGGKAGQGRGKQIGGFDAWLV